MIVEVARRTPPSALSIGVMTSRLVPILVALGLTASAHADAVDGRSIAIAVARAQIVSGVRIGQDRAPSEERSDGETRLRERPCPERDQAPCRLLVVDIP